MSKKGAWSGQDRYMFAINAKRQKLRDDREAWWAMSKGWDRMDSAGLIGMIAAIAGRKLSREFGTEQDVRLGDTGWVEDGIYVAVFEDEVAIEVNYAGATAGYSEMTPGSPASVSYAIYKKPRDA